MAERAAVDEVHAPLLSGYAIADSPPHSQREQSSCSISPVYTQQRRIAGAAGASPGSQTCQKNEEFGWGRFRCRCISGDERGSSPCSWARGGARNRTDLLAGGPEMEQAAASFCCAYLQSSPVAPSI